MTSKHFRFELEAIIKWTTWGPQKFYWRASANISTSTVIIVLLTWLVYLFYNCTVILFLNSNNKSKNSINIYNFFCEPLYNLCSFQEKFPTGGLSNSGNVTSTARTILSSTHSVLFRSILSDIWSSPALYTPSHAGMQKYASSYTFSVSCMPSPFVSYV